MTETTIGVDISKDHLEAHRWPDGAAERLTKPTGSQFEPFTTGQSMTLSYVQTTADSP